MRYVGLVFLGLSLWAGQASADLVQNKEAVKIILEGKIIHKHIKDGVSLYMRVIHKGTYYICYDGKVSEEAYVDCFSVE